MSDASISHCKKCNEPEYACTCPALQDYELDDPVPHPDDPDRFKKVSAPVTKEPEFPEFLKRNKDGTFKVTERWSPTFSPLKVKAVERQESVTYWDDARLHEAVYDSDLSIADRQPLVRELMRRENKEKARRRILEMKAKMAAKEEGGTA